MNCLSVPMLGTLYEQRHTPGCQHRDCMPAEVLAVEHEPQSAVDRDDQERRRMRGENTELCERTPKCVHRHEEPPCPCERGCQTVRSTAFGFGRDGFRLGKLHFEMWAPAHTLPPRRSSVFRTPAAQ